MSTSPAQVLTRLAGDRLAPRAPLTLQQLAQGYLRWMEAHHRPETSIRSYADALGAFLTFTRGVRAPYPDDVTVLTCDAFFAWLRERGASANTTAHRRSVLIAFWLWLEHEGFVTTNVPRKTYPIKVPKRLPVYLEPHQIDELLAKLAALPDLAGRRDHAIVATFFYAGLRVSELTALRLADVDLKAARIRVNRGKGAKDRILVLPPRLKPILAEYVAHVRPALVARPMGRVYLPRRGGRWHMDYFDRGKHIRRSTGAATEDEARRVLLTVAPQAPAEVPWFFVNASMTSSHRLNRAGEPLLTRSIFILIRRRAEELLGVRLSPHKLRHTCATYLLLNGAQLETVQRHLGHEDIRTTMIYLHVPQQRQADEIGRIFG
jgi:integrase/recombinase XerD